MNRILVTCLFLSAGWCRDAAAQQLLATPVVSQKVTIEQAEKLAEQYNPDIRAAAATSRSAAAGVQAADSAFHPQMSVNLFVSGGSESAIMGSTQGVMPSQQMLLGRGAFADQNAVVMLPIWVGGARRAAAGQARWANEAAKTTLQVVKREVELQVAEEYTAVPAQDALLLAARHRLKSAAAHLANDRLAYAQGAQPLLTVRRDEADYAAAELAVSDAQRDKSLALNRLVQSLGINPASAPVVTLQAESDTTHLPALGELVQEASANRPEVLTAKLMVKAALSAISVKKAAYAPQISLFAMGDVMQQQSMRGFAGTSFGFTASVALSNGGLRRAAVRAAEAALEEAHARLQKVVLQVTREAKDAYVQLTAAKSAKEAAVTSVTSATEAYREQLQRFEAGRSTDADVLEALAARTSAEYSLAEARFDLESAYYRLMYAVGRPIV